VRRRQVLVLLRRLVELRPGGGLPVGGPELAPALVGVLQQLHAVGSDVRQCRGQRPVRRVLPAADLSLIRYGASSVSTACAAVMLDVFW